MEDTQQRLNLLMQDVLKTNLDRDQLTTAVLPQWDSLAHLNLIMALEEEFDLKIPIDDVHGLHRDFQTIAAFLKSKLE